MTKRKMVIISAPSGAGKTTIVKRLLNAGLRLEFSISACSRKKRPNEVDAKDYYFLEKEDFKTKIHNKEFVEWEEVYPGSYYGTLRSELERIWGKNNYVIFDVDVMGGINLKSQFKEQALSIFISPPSLEELEKRLIERSTDERKSIKQRLGKAEKEMEYAENFDHIIVNDVLEQAVEECINKVSSFLNDKS